MKHRLPDTVSMKKFNVEKRKLKHLRFSLCKEILIIYILTEFYYFFEWRRYENINPVINCFFYTQFSNYFRTE